MSETSLPSFDYHLPEDRIASRPTEKRAGARLMHVLDTGDIVDRVIQDLPGLLPPASGLWVNETKVLHARLMARKPTGGALELLLLEPRDQPVEQALLAGSPVVWNAMIGGAKKWKSGALEVPESGVELSVEREGSSLRFSWTGGAAFGAVLERLGKIPLPPYMRREADAMDADRYQTVFARQPGSVAAPTAGLHLTERLLADMSESGVVMGKVTLHVGVGTFKPISGALESHQMHGERCLLSKESLMALSGLDDLTVVGTTSLRTLESAFWLASRWKSGGPGPEVPIGQWIHREVEPGFPRFRDAAAWLADQCGSEEGMEFITHLMVVPGYRVQSAQRLLTNFHMPNSTLLCIIEAMMGPGWREAYAHAMDAGYRFLSYGDACLLERSK
jgi:S-adenosylmethionine:tRNA ribosyltransferase-isomerase